MELDSTDRRILRELQADARLSFAELGRRVHLSTPAVAVRVRRLEDNGVIERYTAIVNPGKAGFPVGAFVRLRLTGSEAMAARLVALVKKIPEVVECHRSTGEESFALKVRVRSVDQLASLIDRLTPFGMTSTSLILSSQFEGKPLSWDW